MNKIISVENLSFSYGKKNILADINFSLERGNAVALIGENGSGKSTLMTLLAGIIKPTDGKISVDGSIAYLPQEIALVEDLTFEDNLKFFASLANCKVPKKLPFDADRLRKMKIKRMSGGMKKLCSICCTLIKDADIYMFDEPCAALDKEHRQMLISYISDLVKAKKTVLYVAHDEKEYKCFADTEILVSGESIQLNKLCEAAK